MKRILRPYLPRSIEGIDDISRPADAGIALSELLRVAFLLARVVTEVGL